MTKKAILRSSLRWAAAGVGLAAGAYVTYAGVTWCRYGHPARPNSDEHDSLLDRFMPVYEVVERHHVQVAAPAAVTLAAARDIDLFESPVVRAVFKGRELILHATSPDNRSQPRSLLTEMQSLGWVVLAESPGKEIVVGAVTKPWEANVTFRSLPAGEFAAFTEPYYVKIVWTLRADAMGAKRSMFRTETRVIATDPPRTCEVPNVLVLPVPGNSPDSTNDARTSQSGSRAQGAFRTGAPLVTAWVRFLIAFVVFCHGFIYIRIGSV